MQKRGPWILLTTIIIILVFILGLRYGQKVEQANKTISYILSITPTPKPIETSVKFVSYTNKTCGITFLYPDLLSKEKETTNSAQFDQSSKLKLAFSCDKKDPFLAEIDPQHVATQAVTFQKQKINVTLSRQDDGSFYFVNAENPFMAKPVFFKIDSDLYPLIESSLKFSLPLSPTPLF